MPAAKLFLIFFLPLTVGHAVNNLPGLVIVHVDTPFLGRCKIPFGQAVPAEAGQIHKVNVLYFGMFSKV